EKVGERFREARLPWAEAHVTSNFEEARHAARSSRSDHAPEDGLGGGAGTRRRNASWSAGGGGRFHGIEARSADCPAAGEFHAAHDPGEGDEGERQGGRVGVYAEESALAASRRGATPARKGDDGFHRGGQPEGGHGSLHPPG